MQGHDVPQPAPAPASISSFDSIGFDLDAVVDNGGKNNSNDGAAAELVYEVGGGVTMDGKNDDSSEQQPTTDHEHDANAQAPNTPQEKLDSEAWKERGNALFKKGEYEEAIRCYSEAIKASPLSEEHGNIDEVVMQEAEASSDAGNNKMGTRANVSASSGQERSDIMKQQSTAEPSNVDEFESTTKDEEKVSAEGTKKKKDVIAALAGTPPAAKLAVYYCNRAAAILKHHQSRVAVENEQQQQQDEVADAAIRDSTIAAYLNPNYAKAFLRRSMAHEACDRLDVALKDTKLAHELEPRNAEIKRRMERLQKLEDARMEKLKEETFGKLKELGNSILGNFGLSTDNFHAEKDPSTGSYNIQFRQ